MSDPPSRLLIALLAAGLLGPPTVVGLSGFGLPPPSGTLLLGFSLIAVFWRQRRNLRAQSSGLSGRFGTPFLSVCALALVLATLYNIRLSQFMLDPTRADLSVLPGRRFFREHSCLTAYTEGAKFASLGRNVFELERYAEVSADGVITDRYISSFVVDPYLYPPAFLLLPRAAAFAGLDFLTIRSTWFFVQAALLFGAMALLAQWTGGITGTRLLMLIPFLWLAPPARVGLQMGNFQLTAFPLAVLAMLAFDRARNATGGLALGFATISKIFPGVLGLVLIGTRRWKAIAWTAGCSAALTLLAWWAIGSGPFIDFLTWQLPRIESGEAFPWIEDPGMAPINQSIYGLVTKLRLLGLPLTDQEAAARASSGYAVLVFLLAVLAGLRLRDSGVSRLAPDLKRLRQAQVWLSLLSLASFRSPFVPDAYGFVGTIWLLTLIAAERHRGPAMWIALAALGAAFSVILDGGLVPNPVPARVVATTLGIQVTALGLNLVVLRPRRSY